MRCISLNSSLEVLFMKEKTVNTRALVLTALLSALVVILQILSLLARMAGIPFAISLALIPIVIGASVSGPKAGAWLGLICALVILVTDSAAFMAVNPGGTVVTVLLKGILAGYLSGACYKALSRSNKTVAAIAAAALCPIVNTGIFLLGCKIFFMDQINTWAEAAGFSGNTAGYMVTAFVGINFLIELAANLVLSPAIVHLINIRESKNY